MSWADIETAVIAAVQHASGVSQVRLSTEERKQDRAQRIEVSFELESIEPPEDLQTDVEGGLDLGTVPEVRIQARLDVICQSHGPTVSAYTVAYRLVRRSQLPETIALLGEIVLDRVGRAVPISVTADQRALSAMSLTWDLRVRDDELEGVAPAGGAPRDYFDRVELTDDGAHSPPVALAPDLAPAAVLDVADWRTLWLGQADDLVRGRALVELASGALHDQAQEIGDGTLARATRLIDDAASLEADDRDAGLLMDDLALVLVLRGDAVAGRALSKTTDDTDGWSLETAADGSLELSMPVAGAALATDPGLLDGVTWLLVAVSLASGQVRLHVRGETPLTAACSYAQGYADAAFVIGALGADAGSAGLALALVGEARTNDVEALLEDLAAAIGL